jgi:hypothetical protein
MPASRNRAGCGKFLRLADVDVRQPVLFERGHFRFREAAHRVTFQQIIGRVFHGGLVALLEADERGLERAA